MQRILLVEDNEASRDIYRTILEHRGFRVLECVDGQSAIECARNDMPEAIVLDLVLPILDGWEAARQLKADPQTAQIPILGLTAQAIPDGRERASEMGFARYLIKPIDPTHLLDEVKAVLAMKAASSL